MIIILVLFMSLVRQVSDDEEVVQSGVFVGKQLSPHCKWFVLGFWSRWKSPFYSTLVQLY